jgi:hypothetical protein
LIAGGSITGIIFALLVGTGGINAPQVLGTWFPYFSQPTAVAQLASAALFGALALIVARVGLRKVQ